MGFRHPGSAYAIDDETAIKMVDGTVDVGSEGHWKLFTPEGQLEPSTGERSSVVAYQTSGSGRRRLAAALWASGRLPREPRASFLPGERGTLAHLQAPSTSRAFLDATVRPPSSVAPRA